MKKLTKTMIKFQKYLTPSKMRIAMFGFAVLLALTAPGGTGLDDFSIGGCGGG